MKGVFDSNVVKLIASFNSGTLAETEEKVVDLKMLFSQIKYLQNLERYKNDEEFKKLISDVEDIVRYIDNMIAFKKKFI
jgi:hypothetical protein